MAVDGAASSTNAAYSVAFRVNDNWGAGFVGEISITNASAEPLAGWRLRFDAPFDITNLWNGHVESHAGEAYVVADAGWNATVAPGATATFGFQAGPLTGEPSGYVLDGVPLDGGAGDGATLPTLAIGDVAVPEGDEGATVQARFTVTLSDPGEDTVTAAYTVQAVDATAGTDFAPTSGEVRLAPGQTQAEVVVDVFGDAEVEGDEAFEVRLSNASGATIGGDGTAVGTIANDDAPPPPPSLPEVSVADGTLVQKDTGAAGDGDAAAGFFSTSGNRIVDAAGDPVKIAGVNWFGLETTTYAPHGLWARGYKEMMDQMVDLGFNTIRLPFSNALLDPGAGAPNGIDFARNPDLQGLSGLEIMDRIVDYAGRIGLRIILDDHRLDAGSGAEGSGLWYGDGRTEQDWIDDWTALAQRYAGDPTVIGADLFNEPHGAATWGDGGATDWARAATAAGNAVHGANPDWLVLVEGIGSYQGDPYWWGGHLGGVRDHPIRLDQPDKLVYAPHAYPNSVFGQPWFSDPGYPANLPAKWTETWGYIYQDGIAPVLLGEFGSRFEDPKDVQWMDEMFAYLGGDLDGDGGPDLGPGELGMSWTWWSWNPNSGDTGGILQDDWRSVHGSKVDELRPLMFELDADAGGVPSSAMEFEVFLSGPAADQVGVSYRTADDGAVAGQDYQASSGTVSFEPGETTETVSVPVEPGGDGSFKLLLSDPVNASIGDGEGVGAIGGSGGGGEPIDDPVVPEDGEVVLDLTVRDDWDSGFVADMTVSNRSDEAIDGWRLLLEMPNDIVNIWNAGIADDRGDAYVIENASWNGAVAPGASATLGFQGAGDIDLAAVDHAVIA